MLVLGVGVGGCAQTAREAARTVAPAAAEGTLDTAAKPENRQDVAAIIADPQIRKASDELARSVAGGVFDELTEAERLQALEAFSVQLVERLGPALSKTVAKDLGPAMTNVVANSVDQALQRVMSAENQERASAMALAMTQSVVRGATQQLASDFSALDAARVDTAADWMTVIARNGGRGVALGLQDAVRETEIRRSQGNKQPGDVLALAGQAANFGFGIMAVIVAAVAGAVLTLFALLAWFAWRARRFQQESRKREDALLLVAKVIKSTESAPWANDLHERLREAAREEPAGDTLRDVLRRHAELRLQRQREAAPGWMHDA